MEIGGRGGRGMWWRRWWNPLDLAFILRRKGLLGSVSLREGGAVGDGGGRVDSRPTPKCPFPQAWGVITCLVTEDIPVIYSGGRR